ncbi:hypothetical protein ACFFX1_37840 [Dactylosporangium sucinum]|uniref:Uncharacterized protein n=1 Tax=Dactylosporangium sucinum TaxID=1424081 RepID=A0A917TEN9_9ACTN|nr:hypothetical protein [Dactylosporangium sucinum]GGM19888.1 hypothetical protein GCM10007977_021420 [Dactylosporangium sucinum]
MPDTTPASPGPDDDGSGGVSPAPTDGTPASPTARPDGPDAPTPPPAAPTAPGSASTGGGRGGCMTAMIGLFVFIAALLGIATQL